LEELAGTDAFKEFLHNEFPQLFSGWSDSLNRRDALKLMGASLALAGMTACTQRPAENIVPYVRSPEEIVPGKPMFYATAMTLGGYGTGLLVESHLGRPTKIEGNPQHPASLGATDAFAQASILTLYDPDRSQVVTHNGRISSWISFLASLSLERESQLGKKGAGLRILTETVTSPTLASQLQALLAEFPAARWHQYEPVGRDNVYLGTKLGFGEAANVVYDLEKADVIFALDADILSSGPGHLRYAKQWAARRRVTGGRGSMNRLYAVESTPSNTGAVADHRWMHSGEMESIARAVAQRIGIQIANSGTLPVEFRLIEALAKDLAEHHGSSLVVAGDSQPPVVHAIAHAMNAMLGNVGSTVHYTEPVEANPVEQLQSLHELVYEMQRGAVDLLIILGGNPVYDAPADFNFAENLAKVKTRVHLSLFEDETSRLCHWHIPEAHYLEAWGDCRAFDGTASILQPLIAPLYEGKSAYEVLASLSGTSGISSHDIVREFWKGKIAGGNFEEFWQVTLHDGVMANSALPAKNVILKTDWMNQGPGAGGQGPGARGQGSPESRSEAIIAPRPPAPGFGVIFRSDPALFDGRFANNGWLQELPRPLTKLTWDNAACISPAAAERLRLKSQEMVEIHLNGRSLRAPVWILPGQPDDSVLLHLGHGRSRAGKVGTGIGFNAYALRTSSAIWRGAGAELKPFPGETPLATTQDHNSMEGRQLVRTGTIAEYRNNPYFVREKGEEPARDMTLYPPMADEGYAWGMTINLNSCIGCNACVIACQSENNIPVVGKDQVKRGREMHWLRIDRYFQGELDDPAIYFQPVMCQHCEHAPCEPVCPVAATSHSSEGLNQMVYNRCVGTRYCSNNCPYKVRRFNFLQYTDWETESLKPLRNPDVTVRGRGVMEKCTFCVQRINAAKIQAELEDREVGDGEIVTACQQACPTHAIEFGNINDSESRVAKLKMQPLKYSLLGELNTRPRATYLARLRNPNPAIEKE
jgi:MoCo/4Fe-4S cofactor protein with predicted Tat translocation signal